MKVTLLVGDRISVYSIAAPDKKSDGGKKGGSKTPYKEKRELPGEEVLPFR